MTDFARLNDSLRPAQATPCILLGFHYLSPLENVGCTSKMKEKLFFSLHFTRFSLPLQNNY